jgi:hypothetical protein
LHRQGQPKRSVERLSSTVFAHTVERLSSTVFAVPGAWQRFRRRCVENFNPFLFADLIDQIRFLDSVLE